MAYLSIKNVRVTGISSCVPKLIKNNEYIINSEGIFEDNSDFINTTGVIERRLDPSKTSSDLCYEAAIRLLEQLNWNKDQIDALIFVSQTPDYIVPATSCILQNRLGLTTECFCEDISLGCSGWVYGLATAASLMQSGCFKKVLLLAGEVSTWGTHDDRLFGDAGSATALIYDQSAPDIHFHFGTDGSGYDSIIILDGAARNPFNEKSLEYEEIDGKMVNRIQTRLNGMDVFSFGISTAPKSIKKLCSHIGLDLTNVDYIILHQANKMMNERIIKKLKFPDIKSLSSLAHFGNTSSASIPLTICSNLSSHPTPSHYISDYQLLACGFGIGLSWGSVFFKLKNCIILPISEI